MVDIERFIPCTMEREASPDVVWRPVRSWHSLTYAGEGLDKIPGTQDGSGCIKKDGRGFQTTTRPLTVTHRLYWLKSDPNKSISSFLSYPHGMGCSNEYFWETYGTSEDGEVERFFGVNAEQEMEQAVIRTLTK